MTLRYKALFILFLFSTSVAWSGVTIPKVSWKRGIGEQLAHPGTRKPELNGMIDDRYPKGALNYWKSSFLRQLTDDAIDTMIACFARCPTPMGQLLLEHVHGAVTRVAVQELRSDMPMWTT